MPTNKQLAITIFGHVQGVSFRLDANKWAKTYNLKGYVENRPDGTVYILAQGTTADLNKLLRECRLGPKYAKVNHVEAKWSKPTEQFSTFDIRY